MDQYHLGSVNHVVQPLTQADPPPRRRASWPSAESRAYPSSSVAVMRSALKTVGSDQPIRMTPAMDEPALSQVTWLGLKPTTKASAASRRPNGRLTHREYAGAP